MDIKYRGVRVNVYINFSAKKVLAKVEFKEGGMRTFISMSEGFVAFSSRSDGGDELWFANQSFQAIAFSIVCL